MSKVFSPRSSVEFAKMNRRRLDDELMNLVICRNRGQQIARRTVTCAPRAIEDVLAEIRQELSHTIEICARLQKFRFRSENSLTSAYDLAIVNLG